MKKNILLFIYLIVSVNFAHAQVSESLNCVALKNAADTTYMAYEIENTSMLTGSSYDEERMYETIYAYFRYSKLLLERNCLEEEDRKVLIQRLNSERRQLVVAAPYFYLMREYEKAVEYCRIYAQFIGSSIVYAENKDSTSLWFTDYYAAISSMNTDNHQRTIMLLEWLIVKGISVSGLYELEGIYYYLAEEYLKVGDENKHMEVLENRMKRFPNDKLLNE